MILNLTKKEVEKLIDFLTYASDQYYDDACYGPCNMRALEKNGEQANKLSYKIASQLREANNE